MNVVYVQPYYHNIWEALGIGYIESYCRKHYKGYLETSFYQGYFDNDDRIVNACTHANIVAFSCTSTAIAPAKKLTERIKKINPNVKIVVGGWHVTATKQKPEWADQIVIGEGEKAFLRILEGEEAPIVLGEKLPFSELPHPDRCTIKNSRTVDLCEKMIGKRVLSLQSNRGCPMNCAYCSEVCMTGKLNKATNPIRSRDPKDVCDELESLIKIEDIDQFKFVDATFDISEEYVEAFCNEKISRGITIEWECLVHAAFATEKMMAKLAEANCVQINVGCESGSPKVLKQIRKGVTIDKVKQVFEWAKKYNIGRRAFFILGMPDETEEDIRMTETLADQLDADVVGFTILCPYPGSDFYDPIRHKYISWDKTDEYGNDFWKSNHLENWELHKWQEYLTKKYENKLCERQK
jgi:radical SAM superfamily enzyme YgiQ (UPF0313 family)